MIEWVQILIVLFTVALCVWLGRITRHERAQLGIDSGSVVAADDSDLPAPTLFSARLGLVARPDHLLRVGSDIIPVEQKPLAGRVHTSHVMQVATQCVIIQDIYGKRPPYGLLVLAGGVQVRLPFTPGVEKRVPRIVAEMRESIARNIEPGPVWIGAKCRACGFREHCWG